MAYYSELLKQAFSDTWNLVVAEPLAHLGVAGLTAILTLWVLRRLNRREELKSRVRDYTLAASAFAGVFILMLLLHAFFLTPKNLIEQARRERDDAKKAKAAAEKERDDAKADLLAATKAAPPGSATGTETALAHRRQVVEKLSEFLRDGERLMEQIQNPKLEILPGDQIKRWWEESYIYVGKEMGVGYQTRLTSTAGLFSMSPNSLAPGVDEKLWWALHVRCTRLEQFLEELSKQP